MGSIQLNLTFSLFFLLNKRFFYYSCNDIVFKILKYNPLKNEKNNYNSAIS